MEKEKVIVNYVTQRRAVSAFMFGYYRIESDEIMPAEAFRMVDFLFEYWSLTGAGGEAWDKKINVSQSWMTEMTGVKTSMSSRCVSLLHTIGLWRYTRSHKNSTIEFRPLSEAFQAFEQQDEEKNFYLFYHNWLESHPLF